VLVSRFEDLVDRGLRVLIEEDANLSLVASDVPHEQLAGAIASRTPQVALLNLTVRTHARNIYRKAGRALPP
jgi:hypothetical protein